MKCPKCGYLGFETGDRCRNCGYDFSLLSAAQPEPDYDLRITPDDDVSFHATDDLDHRDSLTLSLALESSFADEPIIQVDADFDDEPALGPSLPAPAAPTGPVGRLVPAGASESALPLFTPAEQEDDEPLIRLSAAPRPPLQVRRTPDTPRLRAVPRAASRPLPGPVLQFSEDPVERPVHAQEKASRVEHAPAGVITGDSSRPGARLIAAAVDHAILLGVDFGVVYFTVRMAGLSMSEWNLLPLVPMLTFLALLKFSYFYAFTAVGGQTIGKMAVGSCVIADDGGAVDAARAMRRTFAGVLSLLLLGLGFVPALFGDRRALHDRLAGTRVVRLRSI